MIYGGAVLSGRAVAVVVPAHNEQSLLGVTLRSLPAFVDRIVVVDDGSSDETWRVLGEQESPRLIRVRHLQNRGVGAAIVTGYFAALRAGAEVIAVMAGDHQMASEDLPRVLAPILEGRADYVKGNRFLHPSYRAMPWQRRWGGKLLATLTRVCTGLEVDDTQCGYTALSRACAEQLPLDRLWPRYGYPNDLLALLAKGGFRVLEVPVRPVYAGEKSGIRAWHLLSIAALILRRRLSPITSPPDRALPAPVSAVAGPEARG